MFTWEICIEWKPYAWEAINLVKVEQPGLWEKWIFPLLSHRLMIYNFDVTPFVWRLSEHGSWYHQGWGDTIMSYSRNKGTYPRFTEYRGCLVSLPRKLVKTRYYWRCPLRLLITPRNFIVLELRKNIHMHYLSCSSQENWGEQAFTNEDTEAERIAITCPVYIATK